MERTWQRLKDTLCSRQWSNCSMAYVEVSLKTMFLLLLLMMVMMMMCDVTGGQLMVIYAGRSTIPINIIIIITFVTYSAITDCRTYKTRTFPLICWGGDEVRIRIRRRSNFECFNRFEIRRFFSRPVVKFESQSTYNICCRQLNIQ